MNLIDIPEFIGKYITKRETSFFKQDIEQNAAILSEKIKDKTY